jgi:Flp pilus assembly protein TadG
LANEDAKMRYRRCTGQRMGAAVVELAFVLPLLLILMVGVWEIGRLIQLEQTMNEAARQGARLASQGQIVNTQGAYTQISLNTGSPNVEDTVRDYLQASGITNTTGLQVTFTYLDGDTTLTQPYQGAKNQTFRVRVTLPYSNLRWTDLSLINPSTLTGECVWKVMADSPFTVSTALPGWSP